MEILKATKEDVEDIKKITQVAFLQYKEQLHSDYKLAALEETEAEIIFDIEHNNVFIIKDNNEILGCIRYKKLSDEIAYVYRFSVKPYEQNSGVGTILLQYVIDECTAKGFSAIALHTNSKYFNLARYYYGKQFFVHSTTSERGYIRALFVKELKNTAYDLEVAKEQ